MRATSVLLPFLFLLLASCSGGRGGGERSTLDAAADEYVRLALAVGRHDETYVDAYYGPPDWKEEAAKGDPRPIPELLAETRRILASVRSSHPSDRREFVEKQLVAVEGYLRLRAGEVLPLEEEARLLYDIEIPRHDLAELDETREVLDGLLPGEGDLSARYKAFCDRFNVPSDKLEAVVRKSLEITRERTVPSLFTLPQGESFEVSFTKGKPWGAYNWYLGDYRSRIEVETALPIELGGILDTMAHEGYPGHHAYHSLAEERLVRGKGWREFSVYPLYGPQSVIAEGTANAGVDLILPPDEKARILKDVLAPMAGLSDLDLELYQRVREAAEPLRWVSGEAARMLLEQRVAEKDVLGFLVRYGLESEERAKRGISFIRTYRAYVFTYSIGEDLVKGFLGDGRDRMSRFAGLLERPVTPGMLVAGAPSGS